MPLTHLHLKILY